MDCSAPGFPVLHCLLESAQTHVHCVDDTIQPSHALSPPSLSALNLSQHQGLFQWVSSSHQVAKVLEFQLQHQSFQWIFSVDFLLNCLIWPLCIPSDSPASSFAIISYLSHTDGPRDPHTEWAKSERDISLINAYIWSLEIRYRWTYLQSRSGAWVLDSSLLAIGFRSLSHPTLLKKQRRQNAWFELWEQSYWDTDLAALAENIMCLSEHCDHSTKCDVEDTLSGQRGQGSTNIRDEPDDCNTVCFTILFNFSPSLSVPPLVFAWGGHREWKQVPSKKRKLKPRKSAN